MGKTARAICYRLSLSYATKRRLKDFIYRNFGFLIKNTATYQRWQPRNIYDSWLDVNKWTEKTHAHLLRRLKTAQGELPKIALIMPVYNPPIKFLEATIASVVNQVYQNWELCIADDASTDPNVRKTLQKWSGWDQRIRVTYRSTNGGISNTTNSAAELATGGFLAFLDHDDKLTPDALAEVALRIAEKPTTDFLYTDNDVIDTVGRRFSPRFKPDWSPELLLSYMYCSHLIVVRRELFEQIGGMRTGFEGSQDHDFAFRATEKSQHIEHIPLILYHWRLNRGATASTGKSKPASTQAGKRAVEDALTRRGLPANVYQPEWARKSGVNIFAHDFPDEGPTVSIIIPMRNERDVLSRCIESLARTTYQNYEIVIVDNESDDPATLDYLKSLSNRVLCISNPDTSFNFAYINNRAVEQMSAEYVLFLNNDTEVREPRWLSQMMGYAQFRGVGAVGARLLFPDGRIQHAGVVGGVNYHFPSHAFKLLPERSHGYLHYAAVVRNSAAVTAACMLTPRKLFIEIGGFDTEQFAVAYNDLDYCYRLADHGYRVVYCPGAELLHYEGHSRGRRRMSANPTEIAALRQKYGGRIDPWYSPHLSLDGANFEIQPRKLVMSDVKAIRMLVCTHNLQWQGAQNSQYELVVSMKEKGEIAPIVFSPADGPLRGTYESNGIEVVVGKNPLRHMDTLEAYNRSILDFTNFIKDLGVELIYANTLQTFYAIDAANTMKLPSVWNVRESEPWQTYFNFLTTNVAKRALECFRYPYRVTFVAYATRDAWERFNSQHNFCVIHNALDLARLQKETNNWPREKARKSFGLASDEVVVLLPGTVSERKGQQDLPLALKYLSIKAKKRIRCFIVGDLPSEYSTGLAQLIAKLPQDLRKKISVFPQAPGVTPYMRAADIFLCTSRIESFPRVVLEAMAHALPIVTTPAFGIREQVWNGVNGCYYSPGNPKELATALDSLVTNEKHRQQLASNARHVLNTLIGFQEMVECYTKIFHEAYLSMGSRDIIMAPSPNKPGLAVATPTARAK